MIQARELTKLGGYGLLGDVQLLCWLAWMKRLDLVCTSVIRLATLLVTRYSVQIWNSLAVLKVWRAMRVNSGGTRLLYCSNAALRTDIDSRWILQISCIYENPPVIEKKCYCPRPHFNTEFHATFMISSYGDNKVIKIVSKLTIEVKTRKWLSKSWKSQHVWVSVHVVVFGN